MMLEVEIHHEVMLEMETHHDVMLKVETRREVHGAVSQMPQMKTWGTWVLARMQQLTQTQPAMGQLTLPPRTA